MSTTDLPIFVSAGEALTDLVTADDGHHERWLGLNGGAGWNVARAMARLGASSAFAGAISTDVFGERLLAASREAGLDLRFLQRVDKAPLLAVVHRLAPPAYFFIGNDSADLHFDPAQLPPGWTDQVRCVHFGGISLTREPLAGRLLALAEDLKRRGVMISYDPNYRALMDPRYDAMLQRMSALADVIKVSDEDLAGLFRTTDLDAAFAQLRRLNPQATCLYTRGGAGASLYVGDQHWSAPAFAVDVVDTVGAGDASMAGLVHSLLHRAGLPPVEHLHYALAAGAAACMAAGATPPSRAAVEALLSR